MKMEPNSLAARRKFLGDPFSLPSIDLVDENSSQRLSANTEKQVEAFNSRRHPRPSALFPVHILPYLYLGNDETAKNLGVLNRAGIRYVINVTSNLPNYFEQEPGFSYLRVPVDDSCSHNLAQFFPEAISFIEKARSENASVLVHCWAGISRSVTVCLAYLMYSLHSTLEEAFDLLLKQNGTIAPNFHFMETLTCWERQLFDGVESGSGSSSSCPSSSTSSTVSSASAFCSSMDHHHAFVEGPGLIISAMEQQQQQSSPTPCEDEEEEEDHTLRESVEESSTLKRGGGGGGNPEEIFSTTSNPEEKQQGRIPNQKELCSKKPSGGRSKTRRESDGGGPPAKIGSTYSLS